MKTEEIIDRLRNPQKYHSKTAPASSSVPASQTELSSSHPQKQNVFAGILVLCILGVAAIVWLIMLNAKSRAEDISSALDPKSVAGLTTNADFNPSSGVTYVQIYEGQDRNVAVDELGTTLPIINRFNYQSITPRNYGIIGMAPWALTENFIANINDPELLRYLLNRKEVAEAFVSRPDVAPLLEDPQLLGAFAQDTKALSDFFESDVVEQVLSNPELVRKIGGSLFMSYLLTSKAVKYYRTHPQDAAKLISAAPALNALRQNEGIRQAVEENPYLKSIAKDLLNLPSANAK